jgi:1,4-dihydroxy-2-naphthoate octaprenyltransferase
MSLLANWKTVLDTGNLPGGAKMDFVSKWLLATRAEVFSMTTTSVFVGAILAFAAGKINILYLLIVLGAMILAHASNNLMNDYFDFKQGLDTPDYERTQYAPHPLASGMMTERTLLSAFFLFGALELAAALYLSINTGWQVMAFAIIGFLISVFYVAPPLKLKYHGLGELAIFIIWGPLITVGTYFVMTKSMPAQAWLASIPYGLVVMNVLLGKHLDKFEKDTEKGVKTLPVVLGWKNAVIFAKLNTAMFYVAVILLVFFRVVTPLVLICFFSLGRFKKLIDILSTKKPDSKPEGFLDIWPLWYVVWAFWFNKLAGGLFIFGLILGCVPWMDIIKAIFKL